MKLLLILTGGTICSFCNENGQLEPDLQEASVALVRHFKNGSSPFKDAEFSVLFPIDTLSENMTVGRWNILLTALKNLPWDSYDGVLVAHGTDTLAYTAGLLSILLAGVPIPVFLVSSNYPLDDRRANGNINFKTAVELIGNQIPPNIYVPYQNQDKKVYIHLAGRLKQCAPYSEDFYSGGPVPFGEYASGRLRIFLPNVVPVKTDMALYRVGELRDSVFFIQPYVGLRYDSVVLSSRVKAVVHGLYHSGTACAQPDEDTSGASPYSLLYLKRRCQEQRIPLYIAPFPSVLASGKERLYASAGSLLSAGLLPICGMTMEMSYIKALIGASMGLEGNKLTEFLHTDKNYEIFG